MNPRTQRTQRKFKMPKITKAKKNKPVVEKTVDTSCDTPGCGCGN